MHINSFKSNTHFRFKQQYCQHIYGKKLNPYPPITLEILKVVQLYTPGNGSCQLCLEEKAAIDRYAIDPTCLNRRSKIGNVCRHKAKVKLAKVPTTLEYPFCAWLVRKSLPPDDPLHQCGCEMQY